MRNTRQKQPEIDWPKVLARQTKATLIDVLVEFIVDDRRISRMLARRFQVGLPPKALISQTREAIADATDYDHREINYNFDYDNGAYETVQKSFERLIEAGHLDTAMDLALELMNSGSEQVEMSDEGLMTDSIEDCIKVVIRGLKKSGLSESKIKSWAKRMLKADRVGFICDRALGQL